MTIGQTCFLHEYCTDCPERRNCTVRPTFYSDEEYQYWRNQALKQGEMTAKFLNFSNDAILIGLNIGVQMMDKRRKKEREIHPTFSLE